MPVSTDNKKIMQRKQARQTVLVFFAGLAGIKNRIRQRFGPAHLAG